ncbi:unnamed protein product [Durusdinium trenchii]|uniref:Uncharacterized protein n=1 Tax=Durusdinium trenchii TaxID=1381693 RepID=A0ABP0PG55_9DINO
MGDVELATWSDGYEPLAPWLKRLDPANDWSPWKGAELQMNARAVEASQNALSHVGAGASESRRGIFSALSQLTCKEARVKNWMDSATWNDLARQFTACLACGLGTLLMCHATSMMSSLEAVWVEPKAFGAKGRSPKPSDQRCFLNATLLLGEESFYSFMPFELDQVDHLKKTVRAGLEDAFAVGIGLSQLPSSSSCLLNHRVGYCDANGINLFHESVRVQVVLSPVESQSLQLESPSLWTLSLVLVVAFANSRYVTKLQAFLVWPLALLGLLLCSVHAARTLVDLGNCRAISEHHPVTWLAAAPLGNRSAPSAAAERVAEYCWVPPLPNLHGPSAARAGAMVEKEPVADFLSRQGIDINMTLLIRDVWITWMESATFSFRFENHTKVSSYCEVLQMPTMSHCLRWMNSSELGNSISCHATLAKNRLGPAWMMSLHCKRAAQNWKAWRKPGARGWDHGETGRETGDWGTVIGAEADGALLVSSSAMFKRDMRDVMEEEFPDLKGLGDKLADAAKGAKDVMQHGQEAVEGLKDLALGTFEAGAQQVNQTLKHVGAELQKMNRTAQQEIQEVDREVQEARDKCSVFTSGASKVVKKVEPLFDQVVEKLKAVSQMAKEVLSKLNQGKAAGTLDKSMGVVIDQANVWKSAMEGLEKKLQEVNELLASRSKPSHNTSKATSVSLLGLEIFPEEELSDALRGPVGQLSSAAEALRGMATQTEEAMAGFVDGALEAAKGKVPGDLMGNVSSILRGVQAEATLELQPFGEIGQQMVDGLKKAASDAGLDFSAASSVMLLGFATLLSWQELPHWVASASRADWRTGCDSASSELQSSASEELVEKDGAGRKGGQSHERADQPHLSDRQRLQQLLRISESWQLKLLQSRGCRARISGQNFALRPPSLGEDVPGGEKALERHLLLLAQHMWETEVLDDLLHLHYKVPGVSVAARPSAVELHGTQESYLQPSFVGCVARIFHGCAERVASATLTHFRSLCQATCALLMFLGYVRMLAIRIGCFRWCREHWPSPEPDSTRLYHFYQCMQRLKERVQQALGFLNTRVGVGLLMASLLQVGFTVLANELAMGWISEGNGVRMAEWMKLYPLSMIDGLMILSIWLQLAVFLLAVCYNCILHVHLRSQILALPRHVLFGPERVIPESYQGPDLNELKRMGKTSLVYAMYFPGIVFWHFFYASWILVLVFSFALGCLILVGQPGEVRSVHAQRIWPVLTYGAFLGTVLLAHFVTRLFTQRCLLHQHGQGIRIRCLCLFTWYEVMLFLLSFAVGPTAALWDYLKGFICTVLASLVIQKPNFTQFGELSDYVYCTYCAALLLERMDRDRKDDSPRHRQHEAELHSCQDLQQNCDRWDSKDEPSLLDSSYESKVACLRRTVVFWLLFLGVPLAAAATVGRASYVLGYSCPKFLKAVLPFSKCASEMKKDVCCPWRWAEFYCWAGQVFWGRIHRGGEGASRGRTRVIPVPWPGITRAAPSRQAVSPEPPSRQAVPEEMTSHVTSPDSIDWRKLRRPP